MCVCVCVCVCMCIYFNFWRGLYSSFSLLFSEAPASYEKNIEITFAAL